VLRIRIGCNADPDTDQDPAFLVNPDPDPDLGFVLPKIGKNLQLEKNIFFDRELQFTYPGHHKGHLSSSRSLHPSKENIWHYKT
jgi:hypothetical protein